MKTILPAVFLAGASILFSGCSNKNAEYNEKLSDSYLKVSNLFEESYSKFSDGEYKTEFEVGDSNGKNQAEIDAQQLQKVTIRAIQETKHLQSLDKASAFRDKMDDYLFMVSQDYVTILTTYSSIDCDCPREKDSIRSIITNLYKQISIIEGEALDEQQKFLANTGLIAKK